MSFCVIFTPFCHFARNHQQQLIKMFPRRKKNVFLENGELIIDWFPVAAFALAAGGMTILLGWLLFKKRPILIYIIPTALAVGGGVLFGLGSITETWDALGYLLIGAFLIAAGGSLIGATIVFFFTLKSHRQSKAQLSDS